MAPSSLIRQSIVSTSGVLVQGLARFAYTLLIARSFGPAELGQINTLLSMMILLSLLWPTASGNAAGTFLARAGSRGESPQRVLGLLWGSFGVSAIVLAIVAVPLAVGVAGSDPIEAVFFAVAVLGWSAYILTRGMRMGVGQVNGAAVWDAISAVISLVLLAVVIAVHADPLVILPLAIGYLAFAAATWWRTRRLGAGLPRDSETRPGELWHLIGWNSAGLIATNGLVQLSMVFAFLTSSPEDAGQYAAAISVATPASMLAQAVSQVLIPRFSLWLHDDLADARRRYWRVLGAMTVVLAIAFGFVALIAGWLMPLLFGEQFAPSAGLVRLLIAGIFLYSVGLIASSFLITSWRTVPSTVCAIAGSVVGLIVMAATLAPLGGAVAAATGVVVGYAVSAVATVVVSTGMPRRPGLVRAAGTL